MLSMCLKAPVCLSRDLVWSQLEPRRRQWVVLKDENLCRMWKFTRNEFFFKHLSCRDSKTVNFFAWFLETVCSYKRYSSWISKKKLEFAIWWKITWFLGALFHACEKRCWCPFFRPSGETYVVFVSGRDSKTVKFFAWFLGTVCCYKRYSSWISPEKPRIRNLVKNNLIFGAFFLACERAVDVLFFDLLEKYILFLDGCYWFQMIGRHLETGA